jgi:hypothetical protein
LADIVKDRELLEVTKLKAEALLETDPDLRKQENTALREFLQADKGGTVWGKIS